MIACNVQGKNKKILCKILSAAPHALGIMIVTAHASEITKIVSHSSWEELAIAGVLFTLWIATTGNIEEI